jgi:hypothetical protein
VRIFSQERDYYDGVAATAGAAVPVYTRKAAEEEVDPFPFPRVWAASPYPLSVETNVVGFCGKLYPVLRVTIDNRFTPGSLGYEPLSELCRSLGDVDAAMERMCEGRDAELLDYYHGGKRVRRRPRYCGYRRQDVSRFFQEMAIPRPDWERRMMDPARPLFLATFSGGRRIAGLGYFAGTVTWNARLAGVEFFRVLDPWRAWQELSMWLGGLASPEKAIPHIPDEIMLQAKGFDASSFRKAPSPRRARTPA